jgi:hypothetical protein
MYGGEEEAYRFWWKNLRERDLLEILGVDGRIIIKRILKKSVGSLCVGFVCLKIRTDGGFL